MPSSPDDELLAQLAHLDALERRDVLGAEVTEEPEAARPAGQPVALSRQPLWPPEVPHPPAPGVSGTSPAPYIAWLDTACAALARRVANSGDELDRLRSQWVHVLTNVTRLLPEEIDAVVEGQARIREGIANDAALHDVLVRQRAQLAAWADALGGPLTDPQLIGRLLDDIDDERTRMGAEVVTEAVDVLSGLTLDLEVVQRQLRREPGQSEALLSQLRDRVNRSTEKLRDHPIKLEVEQQFGERLQQTLQRIVDRIRSGTVSLTWSGPDVRDPDRAAAMAWVTHECVGHVATAAPGGRGEVKVEVGPVQTALRIEGPSPVFVPDGDPSWLVRSRARVAMARGRLLCGRDGDGSFVEVRFR